jgi:uncharacterized membrane protein (DUF2068 family)
MTNEESLKDIRKALTWIDRRQIYGMVAAVLGYGAWLLSLGRLLTLVRGATALPEDLRAVLEAAAIFVVLSAMATQFMICSYLTVLTRRVLRAIHLSAESRRL